MTGEFSDDTGENALYGALLAAAQAEYDNGSNARVVYWYLSEVPLTTIIKSIVERLRADGHDIVAQQPNDKFTIKI